MLLSRQISLVAESMCSADTESSLPHHEARTHRDTRIHADDGSAGKEASLWCNREVEGQECVKVEALDKDAHDLKTVNLLLDLVFLGDRYATHPAPVSVCTERGCVCMGGCGRVEV